MSKIFRVKKGLDIQLKGKAEKIFTRAGRAESYAVKPTDFQGIRPKLLVKPEEEVKVGTPLFFDKYNPDVKFTSPVSGKVSKVNRGERRKILEVVISPDEVDDFLSFDVAKPSDMGREAIISVLKESGMWPSIRQRPYAIIADSSKMPKSIFVSGFDTAPLAPDLDFVMKDLAKEFQMGLDVLGQLTVGKVHLSVNAAYPACEAYSKARNIDYHEFTGPHPAGNPGVQIHHIDPVGKGEYVWYISPLEVVRIGNLFTTGKVDNTTVVALTGSEVLKPKYYKLIKGASVDSILRNNLNIEESLRIISGNPLTGHAVSRHGYVGYYDYQLTVLPEGNYFEIFGWALPGFNKFSHSRTFFSWLQPRREYRLDTNYHGGSRAFVMTGEYDKVLPMNILPVQLLKSILVEDIEKMEALGIYEVAEEDFALCEFVCTSKTEVQEIVRKGLDLMKKETE